MTENREPPQAHPKESKPALSRPNPGKVEKYGDKGPKEIRKR
jgi:hypothetical protein